MCAPLRRACSSRAETPAAAIWAMHRLRLPGTASGPPSRYRYEPATPALRRAVELLAIAYNERPVTLVRAIYDRPSAIQSFADAFRIRKEDE